MKLLVETMILATMMAMPSFALARPRFVEGGPQPLSETRSLGDLIAAGGPLHISFVHGMRAEGPGNSAAFRTALARHLPGSSATVERRYLDLGPRPERATIGTRPIWNSDAEWAASRPFIDRHVIRATGRPAIIVDEINWWPLLFPIKCRFLLAPEHDLSGNDEAHLRLCARDDGPYHPWISRAELEALLGTRPRSGGGARLNGSIKRQILNWGLADAVILLGPMRHYLVGAMEQALATADAAAESLAAEERVLISESLGSFLVLEAFAEPESPARAYLERTHSLYFLANQFALLELARIRGLPAGAAEAFTEATGEPMPVSPLAMLEAWGRRSASTEAVATPRPPAQVIAFSDPSDMLTYRVPALSNVTVVNLYVRNGPSFLGLFADPRRAHTGHIANRTVLDLMLRPSRR